MEKRLGHLLIISSSSHFFNKTDFEQYISKGEFHTKSLKPNQQRVLIIFKPLIKRVTFRLDASLRMI